MPVGLPLQEDAFGAEHAEVLPVQGHRRRPDELTGATAWAKLVAAYPLTVTSLRRHDWVPSPRLARRLGYPGLAGRRPGLVWVHLRRRLPVHRRVAAAPPARRR